MCCADHQALLDNDELLYDVRAQFLRTAERTNFEILAYCILHDHVHLLVKGTTRDSDLRRFVRLAKQFSGFVYRKRRSGKLWQRSYYDRVIRSQEHLGDIARYIVENPVRAGKVTNAADYPHAASTIANPVRVAAGL